MPLFRIIPRPLALSRAHNTVFGCPPAYDLRVPRRRAVVVLFGCTAIPTEVNGGNHTRAFAAAARTPDAHRACYNVAKSLAAVGVRLLTDDAYFEHVSGDVFALIGL